MRTRNLTLDICDYTNKVLCNLYDNKSDASGQATDVFIITERNGWKELTFKLPSNCLGEEGLEKNYRLDYLIADYRIRAVDDYETDWYLISEPKITHAAFSTDLEVRAGHVAQLLKTKAMDLEFSDEEGNNVGTAEELLTTILEGTDWNVGNVAEFLDYDGSIKRRSLEESLKTGAFKMIEDMCDLFEARPVYHGDSKTVDIVPLNPFSKEISYVDGRMIVGKTILYDSGTIPSTVLNDKNVLELHYDKNVFDFSRVTNTENIVTKLYAYGAYGNATLGMCSIQTCEHKEYLISVTAATGTEIRFMADDATYYFTTKDDLTSDTKLIFSKFDFASQSYVWNPDTQTAYHVYKEPNVHEWPGVFVEETLVQNFFPALFNFDYYDKVGLFTDEMLQEVAKYQRDMPILYEQSVQAAQDFNDGISVLSETAQSNTGFLKLDVSSFYETDNTDPDNQGLLKVRINKTNECPDGVIYRSDYMEARKNYFQWYCADQLKPNGLPVSGIGSILFIIHPTNPVTWEKVYVKTIWDDNGNFYENSEGKAGTYSYREHDDEPAALTLWIERDRLLSGMTGDRYYLFCTDSMSGRLGVLTSEDETIVNSISESVKEAVKDGTVDHVLKFGDQDPIHIPVELAAVNYGWYYKFYPNEVREGELYICWGEKGESSWHRIYVSENKPVVSDGDYWLNRRTGDMFHGESGKWAKFDTEKDRRCSRGTAVVYHKAIRRDMIYHGLYEKYIHIQDGTLQAGNYAFKNEYDYYYVFTTYQDTSPVEDVNRVIIDTLKTQVWTDNDIAHISSYTTRQYDTIKFMNENELDEIDYIPGSLNSTGTFITDDSKFVSNFILVYDDIYYEYHHPEGEIFFYTIDKRFISSSVLNGNSFTAPPNARYVRFRCSEKPTSSDYLRVYDYENKIYVNDKMYTILSNEGSGELIGINYMMEKFADTADNTYEVLLNSLLSAQQVIKDRTNSLTVILGDLLRETQWQDDKYVEGDEIKLYMDAMDNLQEVGQPEYTYDFTFLDLFGANKKHGYSVDDEEPAWPDILITDAVHLVDPEIDTNKWAYIDKLEKCYDQEWKTKIEINTKLSLIGQHSFTDLLTRIAEVANETKAKQSIYIRAAALTSAGYLAAEKLDGSLEVARNSILGGSSSWHTDDRGRIVFESADGQSAMMLSGAGLLVSSSKDEFGDWQWSSALTGAGLSADQVAAAFISAREAMFGIITADMISAAAGNELEIGSNKALQLYATANGDRPAGALTTDDSLIEIAAGDGTDKAHINIASGGEINILAGTDDEEGGVINIQSKGELNLLADASMNIGTDGQLNVSGGSINIYSGSFFTLESNNFNIDSDGNVSLTGNIDALSGTIAGFTIRRELNEDESLKRGYIYSGTDSMSSTASGIYLGTDGVNLGGYLKVSKDGSTATFGSTKLTMDAVSGEVNIAGGSINITSDSSLNISSGESLIISSGGDVQIGTGTKTFTIGANSSNAYIYYGPSSLGENKDGVYLGTDGLYIQYTKNGTKNYIKADANGAIDITGKMTAASGEIGGWTILADKLYSGSGDNYVAISSGGDYRIWAGKETNSSAPFSVKKDGTVYAAKGKIAGWDIDSTKIYSTKTGMAKTTNDSDVAFWAGNATASSAAFRVTQAGALTSTNGNIGGWYIGTDYIGNASTLNNSNVGMAYKATNGSGTVFWAGGNYNAIPKFKVTRDGAVSASDITISGGSISIKNGDMENFKVTSTGTLTAKDGTVGGWKIGTNSLSSGSSTTYVELNSNASNTYGLWLGNETASSAPFRVKRTGELYCTKLVTKESYYDSNGALQYRDKTIDFYDTSSTNNSNRLSGATITGWSDAKGQLYTTYGTVNFINPSTVTKGWTGNTYTVTSKSGKTLAETSIYIHAASNPTSSAPGDQIFVTSNDASPISGFITAKAMDVKIVNTSGATVTSNYARSNSIMVCSLKTSFNLGPYWDYAYRSGSSDVNLNTNWSNGTPYTGENNQLTVETTGRVNMQGAAAQVSRSWNFFVTCDKDYAYARIGSASGSVFARTPNTPYQDSYNQGYNQAIDDASPAGLYVRYAGTYGGEGTVHYVYSNSTKEYIPVGKGWYTTAYEGGYYLPDKK